MSHFWRSLHSETFELAQRCDLSISQISSPDFLTLICVAFHNIRRRVFAQTGASGSPQRDVQLHMLVCALYSVSFLDADCGPKGSYALSSRMRWICSYPSEWCVKSKPRAFPNAYVCDKDEDNVACVQCGAEPDVQETINLLRVAKDELGKIQQLASSGTSSYARDSRCY